MPRPNFNFEKELWKKGLKYVAGTDEVGRGAFAGPVVAAGVVFAQNTKYQTQNTSIRIDDSKKLTPRQRERANKWIKENALTWGIGEAPASLINRIGIAKATKKAFRKAISEVRKRLGGKIDFLLIDAFFVPYVPGLPIRRRKDKKGHFRKYPKGRQIAIINGDEKSLTIGAASIIAKVYRDKQMTSLAKQSKYKVYGWGKNKGYGTKEHQKAIKKYGITRLHRKQFVKSFLKSSSSSPSQ